MKTRICLAIVIVANALGNVVLGRGMREVGDITSFSPVELAASGVAAMANPWVLTGVALLLVFFVAHSLVLSWADLSYVLLTTSIGYVLVAALSWFFLGENLTALRWAGTVVITVGVALVGGTPAATFAAAEESGSQ